MPCQKALKYSRSREKIGNKISVRVWTHTNNYSDDSPSVYRRHACHAIRIKMYCCLHFVLFWLFSPKHAIYMRSFAYLSTNGLDSYVCTWIYMFFTEIWIFYIFLVDRYFSGFGPVSGPFHILGYVSSIIGLVLITLVVCTLTWYMHEKIYICV